MPSSGRTNYNSASECQGHQEDEQDSSFRRRACCSSSVAVFLRIIPCLFCVSITAVCCDAFVHRNNGLVGKHRFGLIGTKPISPFSKQDNCSLIFASPNPAQEPEDYDPKKKKSKYARVWKRFPAFWMGKNLLKFLPCLTLLIQIAKGDSFSDSEESTSNWNLSQSLAEVLLLCLVVPGLFNVLPQTRGAVQGGSLVSVSSTVEPSRLFFPWLCASTCVYALVSDFSILVWGMTPMLLGSPGTDPLTERIAVPLLALLPVFPVGAVCAMWVAAIRTKNCQLAYTISQWPAAMLLVWVVYPFLSCMFAALMASVIRVVLFPMRIINSRK